MFAELKVSVKTFANPVTPFLESVVWDDQRAAIDPVYGQPDQYAGIYEVQKIGNGGRELALKDVFGQIFLVHQDHASIIQG